jgi:probable phosphoglycerate mutase
MTKIYLICAAESEGELYRIAQGQYDGNLTDCGWRQVKSLEKRFADIRIDEVYTSDLYRACATAGSIFKPKDLIAHVRQDLREICLGEWEGINWGNIAYEEPNPFSNFKTALDKWYVKGAEKPGQVLDRITNAILQIAAENAGKSVAVVSHGIAIRFLLAAMQDVPLEKVHEIPLPQNTAVAVVEVHGDTLELVTQDDVSHLHDAADSSKGKFDEVHDFDTTMYFCPLPWFEYGEIMAQSVAYIWEEAGEEQPFDKDRFLEDAAMFPTIVGFVEQEPAGYLQLGINSGQIMLLCTHPGCRKAGLGVQLVGQAVMAARAKGEDRLRIALPKKNPYRQFFLNQGFTSAAHDAEGREVLEKDIRFRLI